MATNFFSSSSRRCAINASLTRSFLIDRRSFVNTIRSTRSLFYAAKDPRERTRIDRSHGPVATGGFRQLEVRAVEPLVQDAVAVLIEPEDLQPIAALAREDEQGAALRIEGQPLLNRERQRVERAPHVLPLRAYEDANGGRDQGRCSR